LNALAIRKEGKYFYFLVNDTQVMRKGVDEFEDFFGASGFAARAHVDLSYDNFSLISPGTPPVAGNPCIRLRSAARCRCAVRLKSSETSNPGCLGMCEGDP
jgi:hypothetical protein